MNLPRIGHVKQTLAESYEQDFGDEYAGEKHAQQADSQNVYEPITTHDVSDFKTLR